MTVWSFTTGRCGGKKDLTSKQNGCFVYILKLSFSRACIDTSGTGDLESATLLGTYRETLKYGTLSDRDRFNYGVNIYNEGNLLEIVGQVCV